MRKFVVLLFFFIVGFFFDVKAQNTLEKTNKELLCDLKDCAKKTLKSKEELDLFNVVLKENNIDNDIKFLKILTQLCLDIRFNHRNVLQNLQCNNYNIEELVKVINTSFDQILILEYGNDVERFKQNTFLERKLFNDSVNYRDYVNICLNLVNKKNGSYKRFKLFRLCDIEKKDCTNPDRTVIKEKIEKCVYISDSINKEKCEDYFENTSGRFVGDFSMKLTDKGKSNLFLRKMLVPDSNDNIAVSQRIGMVHRSFKDAEFGPVIKIKTAWGEQKYDDDYIEQAGRGNDIPVVKSYKKYVKNYGFNTGKEFMDWMVGCFDKLTFTWNIHYNRERHKKQGEKYSWYN